MRCKELVIRKSAENEIEAIKAVEAEAFGRIEEATLAEELIKAPQFTVSLVGVCDGKIIGHVMVTEIKATLRAGALGPLAVIPEYREMQVGSKLVRQAIDEAEKSGLQALFVLGDPLYYERFGFTSRSADLFDVPWQGPHFMGLELKPGALKAKKGKLEYPAAFLRV